MNSTLIFISLTCLVMAFGWTNGLPTLLEESDGLKAWEDFLQTYNKTYATDEEYKLRKEQFLKNFKPLTLQNRKYLSHESTYEVGVNQFSDLSSQEFVRLYTGLKFPDDLSEHETTNSSLQQLSGLEAPANLDLRNLLNPVRKQGGCGSCWAFAVIATLEAAFNKRDGKNSVVNQLSEQHSVDCDTTNSACNGGWPRRALEYLQKNGYSHRTWYPYTGKKENCKSDWAWPFSGSFKFNEWRNLDDTTLRNHLEKYGPLVVGLDARPLQSYKSGIMNTPCASRNHAVNLVGYVTSGEGAPYYILRNSWGEGWGERGYFRVSANNHCFIRDWVWGAY